MSLQKSDGDRGTRRLERAAMAALAALAVAVYLSSLPNAFVFDDVLQITTNPWIRGLTHLREIFTNQVWAFAGRDSNYYRPLMHVTYTLVYVVFGPRAWAFRALGILVHAISTVLVFLIARRLAAPGIGDRGVFAAPVVAGLLFAVHPVHTEAVVWISGLPDLACAALVLAGLLAFLTSRNRPDRFAVLHAAGGAASLAAALFKEPGLTLLPLVAVADFVQRPAVRRPAFWITRYGALVGATAIYLSLRLIAIGGIVPHAKDSAFTVLQAIDVAGIALWRYLAMLLWPFPLNVFRTMEDATGLPSWGAWLALGVLVVAGWRRRNAAFLIELALLALPLAPALYAPALLPGLDNPWAERYVYLSSAGFVILAGSMVAYAVRRFPHTQRPAMCLVALVVVVFAATSVARTRTWRDDVRLWSDAAEKSPRAAAVKSYLGWALFTSGDVDRAIGQYREAIALNTNVSAAHHNLAVALAAKGLHESAVTEYEQAIRLKPGDALAHANLALSLTRLRRHDYALVEAGRAVDLAPASAPCHAALGVALGESGRIHEAMEAFRRAIDLDPSDERSRANLATAQRLLVTGQRER